MNSSGPTLRDHAIVLSISPYQEKHLVVQLLTHKHGKLSSLAMNARNSKKRFGGSLQVGHYVVANLQRSNATDSRMLRLDSIDLKDNFSHLRTSFASIDAMSFCLSLVRDLSPEGHTDPAVFVALGRVLRDSTVLDWAKHSVWFKMALWSWWAHHHGFGDLTSAFAPELKEAGLEGVWHQVLAQDEPHFSNLFGVFAATIQHDLPEGCEKMVYLDWINVTGLVWSHFESLHESQKRGY